MIARRRYSRALTKSRRDEAAEATLAARNALRNETV